MLIRKAAAEGVGTALLLAAVVGSGIMGERLAGGNAAIALLANSLATGGALLALISAFGPVSGAHFNPIVTLSAGTWREAPAYIATQVVGALAGVGAANLMFGEPVFAASLKVRSGAGLLLGEVVATFGLVAVVRGSPRAAAPLAVAGYITAAYWFTSSTSFANPAVTLARSLTDTFTGIRAADVPGFIAAQALGATLAFGLFRWLGSVENREPVMKTVLFACVHNAGRSQMAAAFFNALADPERARAISAGTRPANRVHAEVVEAMRELGIELTNALPSLLTKERAESADILVTMGCGEECPVVPGVRREDWPLDDPKGGAPERVREIRDDIRRRIVRLLTESGWEKKHERR